MQMLSLSAPRNLAKDPQSVIGAAGERRYRAAALKNHSYNQWSASNVSHNRPC